MARTSASSLDREAGAIGAPGRLPDFALGEAVAEDGERLGAVVDCLGAEIGVDRAGGGVAHRLLLVRPVLRIAAEAGDGEVDPRRRVLVGEGQRLAELDRRLVVVAGACRRRRRSRGAPCSRRRPGRSGS